jgi:hypothetical protein
MQMSSDQKIAVLFPKERGLMNRLCGLVVRVPGYRSRGHRFDFWRYQIF